MAEAALKLAAQPIQMDQQQPLVYRAEKLNQEASSKVSYKEILITQADADRSGKHR